MSVSTRRAAQLLVGKRIASVDVRAFDPNLYDSGRGPETYDPVIGFTDGSFLVFAVDETDVGEYGIRLIYRPKTRGKQR